MSSNENSFRHTSYGMPMNRVVARELALEQLQTGRTMSRAEIVEAIYAIHVARGGREMPLGQATGATKSALSTLVKSGIIERLSVGWYRITSQYVQDNPVALQNISEPVNTSYFNPTLDHSNEGVEVINKGVYVYSYPSYMPQDELKGVGLYKVGASTDIDSRVFGQGRSTEVPEDPQILRRFYSDEPLVLESMFHKILKAADMQHKTAKGGTEWFRCTLFMIDTIAEVAITTQEAK